MSTLHTISSSTGSPSVHGSQWCRPSAGHGRPPTVSRLSSARPYSKPGTSQRPRTSASTRPRTTLSEAIAGDLGSWVVAVIEGRGVGREVGIVALDTDSGRCIATQFSDSQTYVKSIHTLNQRYPTTLLVKAISNSASLTDPSGLGKDDSAGAAGEPNLLLRCLQEAFDGVHVVGIARKDWNGDTGFDIVSQLIVDDDEKAGVLMAVKSKFYCLSAAAALFKYLERSLHLVFPPGSVRIKYAPMEGTMLIDSDTAINLELVSNVCAAFVILNPKSKQSLFGLLCHSYTPMATRLLRTNILGPPTDMQTIDQRLDAVEELVGSEEMFTAVRKALKPLDKLDVDKLIGSFVSTRPQAVAKGPSNDPTKESERKIAQVLQLRILIQSLPNLCASLNGCSSVILRMILDLLSDDRMGEMEQRIDETINDDAVGGIQKGAMATTNNKVYAVKANRKAFLDIARETYRENINDTMELAENLRKKYDLPIQALFQPSGFVLQLKKEEVDGGTLPNVFTNVQTRGKNLQFTSLELKKRNQRILHSLQEIFLLSDEVLDELVEDVRGNVAALYRCSEAIAMLDMLVGFSNVSSTQYYVRPEFCDTLAIKAGRHPIVERFRLEEGAFVPNDTYANEATSFQILTGPNMSGKSTFLRQIALLVVMAQVGVFVPAEYASFRIHDALLSRLSNDDDIEANLSTFAAEMRTMAMILSATNVCKHPLIIVDELGRGTSPEEGVGIAHAMAEEIIKAKAFCFFASHFKDITTTLSAYPNVVNLHLETEVEHHGGNFDLTFPHRVLAGESEHSHYGLELARLAALPPDVLSKAEAVTGKLESLERRGREAARSSEIMTRRKTVLNMVASLRQAYNSSRLPNADLRRYLQKLQADAVAKLTVDEESDGENGDTASDARGSTVS